MGLCCCPTDTCERTLNGPASSGQTVKQPELFGIFSFPIEAVRKSGAGGKKTSETGEIPSKIAFGCGRAAQLGFAKIVRYSEKILHMLI